MALRPNVTGTILEDCDLFYPGLVSCRGCSLSSRILLLTGLSLKFGMHSKFLSIDLSLELCHIGATEFLELPLD